MKKYKNYLFGVAAFMGMIGVVMVVSPHTAQVGNVIELAPGLTPFQEGGKVVIPDGSKSTSYIFKVPDNTYLVIETVTAWGKLPVDVMGMPGNVSRFSIKTTVSGVAKAHFIPLFRVGENFLYLAGCQQVRLYADPGSDVIISCFRVDNLEGRVVIKTSVSGFLEPLPPLS